MKSPARARELGRRAGAGVIKAIAVATPEDLAMAAPFEDVADYLMFDAKAPAGADRPGGLGTRLRLPLAVRRAGLARPWFLAGGLDPLNVAERHPRLSGAPLVDVSSGVERGPGLKDPALIDAFLEAVRRA